jgi:hypothetical protein
MDQPQPDGGKHATDRPQVAAYFEGYREVATARGLLLVDHYRNWLKIMTNDLPRFDRLVPDRIHPQAEGYQQVLLPELKATLCPPPATDAPKNAADTLLGPLAGHLRLLACWYDGSKLAATRSFVGGELRTEANRWTCDVRTTPVPNENDALDLSVTFKLTEGMAKSAGVAVAFDFAKWSPNNYVLIPASVYHGNRNRIEYQVAEGRRQGRRNPPSHSKLTENMNTSMNMKKLALFLAIACACMAQAGQIMVAPDAPAKVKLAAKEVRRYVYLRTGELLPIGLDAGSIQLRVDGTLQPQQFRLQSDGKALTITGGSDIGVLYGAYAFIEKLGVRFYLHGDVIPDGRIPFVLPVLDETRQPLFELRGVNPWGCHPAGMDAWTADDYKAVFSQLAKMRMNFLGIHTYPDGLPFAEPTVWHGLSGDFDAQGQVKFSYPSHYFSTLASGFQGYVAKPTGDYGFGGSLLFERDDWAPPVMVGQCPQPTTPEGSNEVFNRMAVQFREAFGFARQLGVKTCLGTEAPLTIPKAVQARLKAQGKNPADPTVVRAVYEATFRRIMASHPLDYYWLWTSEGWRSTAGTPEHYQTTVADIKLANAALHNVQAPFKLATAGWVLGPRHDRGAYDADLPKSIALSTLNEELGTYVVDPAFGKIVGREKWAIPWLESDVYQGLAGVQLLAGRMRRDAADAAQYGCTGLMGLHWRTDILAPNVSALAQAAWDQNWPPAPATTWQMAGSIADFPGAKITGTADEVLYRSCRYDLKTLKVKVPNGQYKVTLKFCEPHFKASDQRVFDVQIQGRTLVENLDIFAKVGQFAALDLTFGEVAVSDGVLTIDLIARKSLPCISAIAVEGPAFSSKLNCGGPASGDWLADTASQARDLPCGDFYADWALANFGPQAADDIARLFTALDGKVPLAPADGCPVGELTPNATPWSALAAQYAFVDDFAKLRARVRGAGNLERCDYWQNTFSYYRLLARVRCALGAKAPPEEITKLWGETYRHLLASVNTPGALAAVVTMENYPGWGPRVAPHATQPWPKEYQGAPRLIVTTVRSLVARGEALKLKIIALDNQPMKSLAVKIRPLGTGRWKTIPGTHLARAVYQAQLPAAKGDFEYYLTAETASGQRLVWPATAPSANQTVVTTE